ncbi:MAG: FAD-dependent oxidoreductase [Candidatus Geothermarchaeales archaeon]
MEKFDVIVVGAGPAGSSAACRLCEDDLQVLLIERGSSPGSKNMFGGRIYPYSLDQLLGEEWKEAPIERFVTKENITFLTEDSSFTIQFEAPKAEDPTQLSFTANRARFDLWLASKAEDRGAELISGIKVEDLVFEDGGVVGVVAGGDEVRADLVIAADGAMSLLSAKAGLRAEMRPEDVEVGIKEVIELPRETIEERFNLAAEEGAASVLLGAPTEGLRGGAFLYTNLENLSLGIVIQAEDVVRKVEFHKIVEKFKGHPKISKLIEGGKVVEYSSHLIAEAGLGMLRRRYTNGLLVAGDAAGFLLNNGYTFRGVDMAIASGLAAADTFKEAKRRGDFSRSSLAYYDRLLEESSLLADLETFGGVKRYLKNPRLYSLYPRLVCSILKRMYIVNGKARDRVLKIAWDEMRREVSPIRAFGDLIGAVRNL